MAALIRPWGVMQYRVDGPEQGETVVFANSLGTDLRLWDDLLAALPGIRAVRFDKPGHGLSDLPSQPVSIASLAEDTAALIETVAPGPVLMVGLSIGGMIAQQLARARPDLLRGLVLSNTDARMGTAESWQTRIAAIRAGGLGAIADPVMERWFAPAFRARADLALWRNMLLRVPVEGYAAACEALAAADLAAETAQIRLPVAVIAGTEDGASPPENVAALARMIAGASFHLIPGVGHIPPVEAPEAMAEIIRQALEARP